jgi:hypothetical protein
LFVERSAPRLTLAPLLLLHLLIKAIDSAVELIDPLAVLLSLTRSGLRLSERLTGRAFNRAQPPIDTIDPRVDGGDLPVDVALRGATTEADGPDQDYRRCRFREVHTHLLTFSATLGSGLPTRKKAAWQLLLGEMCV